MFKIVLAVLAALAFFIAPVAAQMRGQQVCLPRDRVVEHLADKYGEEPRGLGVSGQAGVIEIWASNESGSWTLLLTRPDSTSCVIGTGEGWQDYPTAALDLGEPL